MNNFTKLYRSFAAGAVALTMTATSAWAEGSIVSFNGPAGEAYIGKFIKGIKATAELKGFDICLTSAPFGQI